MPRSSVRTIVLKFKKSGLVINKPRSGRKRITTQREDRLITGIVKHNRFSSALKVKAQMKKDHGIAVSTETVRRRLHEEGLNGRAARAKPYISPKNRIKRLAYAKRYQTWTKEHWRTVMFTDESKFKLKCSDGRVFVWRKVGEEHKLECLKPTVKNQNQGVMIWGCISYNGMGKMHVHEGKVNSKKYLIMLEDVLAPSADMLELTGNLHFMQDNAPIHKAKKVMEYLNKNCSVIIEHPPQSPDLNPIEHVWAQMKQTLRLTPSMSVAELENKIKECWNIFELEKVQKLIESMPDRIKAVIESKGGPTKY